MDLCLIQVKMKYLGYDQSLSAGMRPPSLIVTMKRGLQETSILVVALVVEYRMISMSCRLKLVKFNLRV